MTQESRYYAGYNTMLHHCFCDNSRYTIAPQAPPPGASRAAVNFMVLLVVVMRTSSLYSLLELRMTIGS